MTFLRFIDRTSRLSYLLIENEKLEKLARSLSFVLPALGLRIQ